ncbi:PREDICTED: far upstream element-binding protein 2, partial [Corvus brachyrhynchos]|uniref:far upstream element-binding protein 2 n=1 Tax=Corvus brachyrhynchos TaxID=85066 RepID=UPI0008165722
MGAKFGRVFKGLVLCLGVAARALWREWRRRSTNSISFTNATFRKGPGDPLDGGGLGDPLATGQNGTVQELMIPAGKAGLVIGKGGETIKQLQERAGVKMILIQDGSQNTNVDKPLRIIGEPYKVQQACEMVLDILRERDQGGFGERSDYGARLGGGIDVPVPRHSVGVVIGRSGEMIKKIQNDAGVRIQFKQGLGSPFSPQERPLPIDRGAWGRLTLKIPQIISSPPQTTHKVPKWVLIGEVGGPHIGLGVPRGLWSPGESLGVLGGFWSSHGEVLGSPGEVLLVPERTGGSQRLWGGFWGPPAYRRGFWGAGGENVKAINQQTGAFVEISRQLPPNGDPNFKLFVIRGTPQQIDHAKQLIEEKIEGPLCPVGPGPGPGGPPGPAGPMGPFNPGPFNQGPPGAPPHPGGPP